MNTFNVCSSGVLNFHAYNVVSSVLILMEVFYSFCTHHKKEHAPAMLDISVLVLNVIALWEKATECKSVLLLSE